MDICELFTVVAVENCSRLLQKQASSPLVLTFLPLKLFILSLSYHLLAYFLTSREITVGEGDKNLLKTLTHSCNQPQLFWSRESLGQHQLKFLFCFMLDFKMLLSQRRSIILVGPRIHVSGLTNLCYSKHTHTYKHPLPHTHTQTHTLRRSEKSKISFLVPLRVKFHVFICR